MKKKGRTFRRRGSAKSAAGTPRGFRGSLRNHQGLAQLLARPGRCRVRRHIAVNQPSTAMLDHHQYVQEPEGARHGHEEVARHDCPRIVLQERRPALLATWATQWGV